MRQGTPNRGDAGRSVQREPPGAWVVGTAREGLIWSDGLDDVYCTSGQTVQSVQAPHADRRLRQGGMTTVWRFGRGRSLQLR